MNRYLLKSTLLYADYEFEENQKLFKTIIKDEPFFNLCFVKKNPLHRTITEENTDEIFILENGIYYNKNNGLYFHESSLISVFNNFFYIDEARKKEVERLFVNAKYIFDKDNKERANSQILMLRKNTKITN